MRVSGYKFKSKLLRLGVYNTIDMPLTLDRFDASGTVSCAQGKSGSSPSGWLRGSRVEGCD